MSRNQNEASLTFYQKYGKRGLDILLSCAALVPLSPVLLTTAVLVRVFHGKPILFSPTRPGKDENIFHVYKFRTMSNKTDETGKLLPDKERITLLGKFLRASSLDELPEVFNILLGDMSIVGPRPLAMKYLPYYTDTERRRHSVRPGLTGLAQVNGRNNLIWDKRFAKDLEYLDNITFRNDVAIVLQTALKVLKKSDVVVPDETTSYQYDTFRTVLNEQRPHPADGRMTFREMGSGFWLPEQETLPDAGTENKLPAWLPEAADTVLTFSGRSAIALALRDAAAGKKIRSAYVPSYGPFGMLQPLIEAEIPYHFYDVTYKDGQFYYHMNLSRTDDLVLLMPYFGKGQEQVAKLAAHYRRKGCTVIEDITHTLLSGKPCSGEADYTVASLRAWFPVPAGGWLGKHSGRLSCKPSEDGETAVQPSLEAMRLKRAYIAGETDDKVPAIEQAVRFESNLVQIDPMTGLDRFSQAVLLQTDAEQAADARRRNAAALCRALRDRKDCCCILPDDAGTAPLFVPLLVHSGLRNALQAYLAENGIYCPVTWRESIGAKCTGIRRNELSLICDQRYTEKDMLYQAELIVRFLEQHGEKK